MRAIKGLQAGLLQLKSLKGQMRKSLEVCLTGMPQPADTDSFSQPK